MPPRNKPRRQCRFFSQPGGCRAGDTCTFQHSNPQQGTTARPSAPTQDATPPKTQDLPSNTGSEAPNAEAGAAIEPSPPGVCRVYWVEGGCRNGFNCRYRHILHSEYATKNAGRGGHGRGRGRGGAPTTSSRPFISSGGTERATVPLLTEESLETLGTLTTDGYFPVGKFLNTTEAHNRLQRFLFDKYEWRSTFEVYAFLQPLSSANVNNPDWTEEDRQSFLKSITNGVGCLRIAQIMNWKEGVSLKAGMSKEILSFQRATVPLLAFLGSEAVVKSTLVTQTNRLFTVVLQNFDALFECITSCMDNAINNTRTLEDRQSYGAKATFLQVFVSLCGLLHELLTRFKNAVAQYPRLAVLVSKVEEWFKTWKSGIMSDPPLYANPFSARHAQDTVLVSIGDKIDRLASIVSRETLKLRKEKSPSLVKVRPSGPSEGLLAALETTYEGPGPLRAGGPRHDNDARDISEIRIAPTHGELMSPVEPYLPANFYAAPHHEAGDSMERLLDIQFRLLREELTAPLRKAIQAVHHDLVKTPFKETQLCTIFSKKGGKYHTVGQDSLMFNVYTNVRFLSLVPDWKGVTTSIVLDSPPGRARNENAGQRAAFWQGMGGKRLFQGGLIALVWQTPTDISVHLATISSSSEDLVTHAKQHQDTLGLRIVFFDAKVQLRILRELRNSYTGIQGQGGCCFLVETPVMYDAIRPFLESLKVVPEDVPFHQHLVLQPEERLKSQIVPPPAYARRPRFRLDLSSLFPDSVAGREVWLKADDPTSIADARTALSNSRLDLSQADAVVDTLTREIALIQGPPGTGKSYTGVEILRVLIANKVGPILMIAFTNHALDHMLSSVLDSAITKKIVRLGRRVKDERVAEYNLETLEKLRRDNRLDHSARMTRRDLKGIQERIKKLMLEVKKTDADSEDILAFLDALYPEHRAFLDNPPPGLVSLKALCDAEGQWETVGARQPENPDLSVYAFWRDGQDLHYIEQVLAEGSAPRPPNPLPVPEDKTPIRKSGTNAFQGLDVEVGEESEESEDDNEDPEGPVEELWKTKLKSRKGISADDQMPTPPSAFVQEDQRSDSGLEYVDAPVVAGPGEAEIFFQNLGFDTIPAIPSSDRPLEELLDIGDMVWSMSYVERRTLHAYWAAEAQSRKTDMFEEEFDRLCDEHHRKLKECDEERDTIRRGVLQGIDIIGCTTTGAAQLTHLLGSLSPKVLLVEEAGQVLEAHILGSLVPSIEHLILIGDPLQLRPTLNNYSLSMDSKQGSMLYRFDMSLMERLSSSGFPMSQIDVQRRMRPTISNLIRTTLYPKLEDHDLVKKYPDVRGMKHNVYFLTHSHRENQGADDSASKFNTYEVEMIRDLVLYLLRQGCYSNEGDIVVLCAYLGQLARLRDALAKDVAISIDERDQAELDDQDAEKDSDIEIGTIQRVSVTKRVRLRTVDNYQGEEGKIVILSLVRNAGGADDEQVDGQLRRPNIGFLKSHNRTNVALSRAREGLYIFGNSQNLATQSSMWRSVIKELDDQDLIGESLHVVCNRHPETVELVSQPGQLPLIAPDGGCMRPCDARLSCGHICSYKCHSDDPKHVAVLCEEPCRRLCARDHPCQKRCRDDCGQCQFPIRNVTLPCGHIEPSVPCWQLDTLDNIRCSTFVKKSLPKCEHSAVMRCGEDPNSWICMERCDGFMPCCRKMCSAACSTCQAESQKLKEGDAPVKVHRTNHQPHACQKDLQCGHRCQEPCLETHIHTLRCSSPCRQRCAHARCKNKCSDICSPCKERCPWRCAHFECPVPCGSICARLPCDLPCKKKLKCGHPCPSVCGEVCSEQLCAVCASPDQKGQVVDLIMHRSLSEIDLDSVDIDERLITIPDCGHTFTVETLDGVVGMSEFYQKDNSDPPKWASLLSPEGQIKPPTCPTCRASIRCRRYGRIFKRADLDILEHNTVVFMSQSLTSSQDALEKVEEAAISSQLAQASSKLALEKAGPPPKSKQQKARQVLLEQLGLSETPAPYNSILPSTTTWHSIDPAIYQPWSKAVRPLTSLYNQIRHLCGTTSSHRVAWEASVSLLFEAEMERAVKDPERMPENPEQNAMRLAKLNVGQPKPLADRRFLVEAIWTTLDIRLSLVGFAQQWLSNICDSVPAPHESHVESWAAYLDFLIQVTMADAVQARQIAINSESRRQIVRSSLYCLRLQFWAFRFNLFMSRKAGVFLEIRDDLAERARQQEKDTQEEIKAIRKGHLARFSDQQTREREEAWLQENFDAKSQSILDEWQEIRESIERDTFYQPVTDSEKIEIIRAMNFASTGHFYTCRNGHVFVIGECGGAMETSRCSECGELIGGQSHSLDPSNRRANDFDQLARTINSGVRESPWANPY